MLGARLLVIIIIMEVFMYWGLVSVDAVPDDAVFGKLTNTFGNMTTAEVNASQSDLLNVENTPGVQALGSADILTLGIGFVINALEIAIGAFTMPWIFASIVQFPIVVQILFGMTFNVMLLYSVASFVRGAVMA